MSKTEITVKVERDRLNRRMQGLVRKLPQVTDKAMQRYASDIKAEFEITTYTWDHRPEFKVEPYGSRVGQYRVSTNSAIYGWVDMGTRPHPIVARRAPFLVFALGFVPKTQPRDLGSYNGRRGNVWVRAKRVKHPGIRARKFKESIVRKFTPRLVPEYIKPALEEATYGGGFGL